MFAKFVGLFFRAKRSESADRAALVAALNDPRFTFRTIGALSKAVKSADVSYVTDLLVAVGARQERRNKSLWTLAR